MPKTQNDTDDSMGTPKDEKMADVKYRHQENTTRDIYVGLRGKYLTAWTSPDGSARRKIDYIMIYAKYRNKARTAQRNTHWDAYFGPKPAAPIPDDSTIQQRREEVQDTDPIRHRGGGA